MRYPAKNVVAERRLRLRRGSVIIQRMTPGSKTIAIFEPITFVGSVDVVSDQSVADVISFLDAVTSDKVNASKQAISFQDEVICNKTITRSFVEAIGFQDSVIVLPGPTNQSTCDEGYQPAVPLGTSSNIVLTYPFVTPSISLTLRNPKFGNTQALKTNVRYQRTRSGQLNVVRGNAWPTFETIQVSIEALSESQVASFKDFIKQSAAFEVGYLDQEARQWRGVVTNPVVPTVQVGIGCLFDISFDFRGRLA